MTRRAFLAALAAIGLTPTAARAHHKTNHKGTVTTEPVHERPVIEVFLEA